jgi:hypothetical protein
VQSGCAREAGGCEHLASWLGDVDERPVPVASMLSDEELTAKKTELLQRL